MAVQGNVTGDAGPGNLLQSQWPGLGAYTLHPAAILIYC
jgi:hypothetical protein